MSRAHRTLLVAAALLLALGIVGIRTYRPASGSAPAASVQTETHPHTRIIPELAAIFAEPDRVRRLHLLAGWVEVHGFEEINAQVALLRPPERDEFLELAQLKIRDAHPDASEWVLLDETRQLFAATQPPRPPTLRDQLLAEAATDPAAALRRALSPSTPLRMREDIAELILEEAAHKDLREAMDLTNMLPRYGRVQHQRSVLKMWTSSAPAEALAWALQDTSPAPLNFVGLVMSYWSNQDPEAALEASFELPPEKLHPAYADSLLTRWLHASPTESVAWLRKQPSLSPDMLSAAFNALSGAEPAFVATLLDHPMTERDLRSRTRDLVESWSAKDPQAATRWLQTRPRDETFFQAARALAKTLAARDPDAAFAFFSTLPADADLGEISAALATNLPNPARAVEWLLARPDSRDYRQALETLLARLGAVGGSAQILGYAQRIPPGAARSPVYAAAIHLELEKNPASATALLRGISDPAARDATLALVANQWARASRADALAFAQELAPGPGRDAFAAKLIDGWPRDDSASAFNWALALPASEKLGRALADLAESQPSTAVDFVGNAPAGPLRDAALTGLVYGTLKESPARAAELLFAFGASEMQPNLAKGLADRWAAWQPREATAWAQGLPAGAIRDRALSGVVGHLAKKDPPATLALLPLAQDPESRYLIARQALLGQQHTDETGARRTLANLQLPAADIARLRDDLDSHR